MKTILTVISLGLVTALVIALARNRTQTTSPIDSTTTVEPTPNATAGTTTTPPRPKIAALVAERREAASRPAVANDNSEAANLTRTVDVLVTPQSTFEQKVAAWNKLRTDGKLDEAIQDLEQRAAANPKFAEFPAALGQAYLQKAGTLKDLREQGILGMKADQTFETALGLDASNWEARFFKTMAMSYWPPQLNKGDEVIEQFQTLIKQQESQSPQPQFAQSYLWLGTQYAKSGNADEARTVWQRGAQIFPHDQDLRTKLQAPQ